MLDAHAAVSGVAIVTGQLGAVVGTSAILAERSLGKVQQIALTADAGTSGTTTYTGTVQPFLTGIAHPVAVVLGTDAALYVGDRTSGVVYRTPPRRDLPPDIARHLMPRRSAVHAAEGGGEGGI